MNDRGLRACRSSAYGAKVAIWWRQRLSSLTDETFKRCEAVLSTARGSCPASASARIAAIPGGYYAVDGGYLAQ
jgi:hypothetical protein